LALELVVEGVDAGYGAVRALHGILHFSQGKRNRGLAGHERKRQKHPDEVRDGHGAAHRGTVVLTLDGKNFDLTKLSTEEIVNLGVALVPEGRRLFPKLTVEENLLLGAFRPLARADIAKNLALCYETFEVLKERRRQLAGSMSGGQQQMLAIARALMSSPGSCWWTNPRSACRRCWCRIPSP
jgi:branched-chain amino acid transport system ATP-binding protein